MSKFKKPKTIENMQKVFDKFLEDVKRDNDLDIAAKHLDQMLNDFYVTYPDKTEPTEEGVVASWELLMDEARNDETARKDIAKLFNDMLDDLLGSDFFGTEGQCDPRGDHRS